MPFVGLQTTLSCLAGSRNQCATAPLLAAIDSSSRDTREGAFKALLTRRNTGVERQILARWPQLSHHWKQLLAERSGWLLAAIREAILQPDDPQLQFACQAVVRLREYDLIPQLISGCENKGHPQQALLAATLLELVEALSEELAAPRDYRDRRDPQLLRTFALGGLEAATDRFAQHRRVEILDSLLLLANRDTAALKAILQNPCDQSFSSLVELLQHSPRLAVIRLLLTYLDDSAAPLSVLRVIGQRYDISFLRMLCSKLGGDHSPVVRANLKRIDLLAWLHVRPSLLAALTDHEQVGAVALAQYSGISRDMALQTLAWILQNGQPAGRRAAAESLATHQGVEANAIAIRAFEDEDLGVRICIARQLRERRTPCAMKKLLSLLDGGHPEEQKVAVELLSDYSFQRYVAQFDNADDETRETTGKLVCRVDAQARCSLADELQAPTKHRRRRAIEIAIVLRLVPDVEEQLIGLLQDEDQYLRYEAIRALAVAPSETARRALQEATGDSKQLVQHAAQQVLNDLAIGAVKLPDVVPDWLEPAAVPAGA